MDGSEAAAVGSHRPGGAGTPPPRRAAAGVPAAADALAPPGTWAPPLSEPLRARWYVLVLAILVGAALGYVVSGSRPPVYEATAVVMLRDASLLRDGVPMRPDSAASFVALHAAQLDAPTVHEAAGAALGISATDVATAVDIEPDVTVLGVNVTASASSAEAAGGLANAVAEAYEALELERARDEVREETTSAERRLAGVEARLGEALLALDEGPDDPLATQRLAGLSAQQLELQARLDELDEQLANPTESVALGAVRGAVAPVGAASPRPIRDAGIVAVAAGLAAAAALWFAAGRTPGPSSGLVASTVLGVPLLAVVQEGPAPRRRKATVAERPDGGLVLAAEAITRALGDGPWALLVMGVGPGPHATRVAEGLVATLRSGTGAVVALLGTGAGATASSSPLRGLLQQRAAGAAVVVVAPDAGSGEFANLALASDAVLAVVPATSSRRAVLEAGRNLAVLDTPTLGYVLTHRAR
jgi:hypothetical protein